jgi:hypothetical protein
MLNETQLQKLLPPDLPLKYKLAIKALIVQNALYDDVCMGCGIDTEQEIQVLESLLSQLNYQVQHH